MSGDYDFVLSGAAVRSLLGAPNPTRRRAENLIESLAANPFREPDFRETGPSGRVYSVIVEGDIVLAFWVDHAGKELRILRVEFV